MRFGLSSSGSTLSLRIWSYTQKPVAHHPPTKAWNVAVRNVTAVITSKESTMCTPPLPRDVWTLSNSTICFLAQYFLSLPLFHTHTLSSRPSLLGEHMRRSDPTLILLPLLSIIQSALLGKQEKEQKEKRTHKHVNNPSPCDKWPIEISLSHTFALI